MNLSGNTSERFKLEGHDHNEFAHEVLNILRKRKVTFRGCKPDYIELCPLGGVRVHFFGYRKNRPYKGAVEFACPFTPDKIMMANPAIVAHLCEEGINLMKVS